MSGVTEAIVVRRLLCVLWLTGISCIGCSDDTSSVPRPGRAAKIYTGFGLPRGAVVCFKSHGEATAAMRISKQVNGYSSDEWYWKLPPEDREKYNAAFTSGRVEKAMFDEGYWIRVPFQTRCVVLDDTDNGRGDGSPYKVMILEGEYVGQEWWVFWHQLDLERGGAEGPESLARRIASAKASAEAKKKSSKLDSDDSEERQPTPRENADFTFANVNMNATATYAKVVGEVTNTSSKTYEKATFAVKLYGKGGELLETAYANVDNLAGGETKSFEADLSSVSTNEVENYKVQFESEQ